MKQIICEEKLSSLISEMENGFLKVQITTKGNFFIISLTLTCSLQNFVREDCYFLDKIKMEYILRTVYFKSHCVCRSSSLLLPRARASLEDLWHTDPRVCFKEDGRTGVSAAGEAAYPPGRQ